jgi:hypothetical protein
MPIYYVIGLAKRNPLNVKKIEPQSKDYVLSPGFLLRKEGKV